jgi:phosphotransferase system IIA component
MSNNKTINGHYENVPAHLEEFCRDTKKLISYDQKLAAVPFEALMHFAIDCVHVNHKHYNHIFKQCCCICDKELTEEDLKTIENTDNIVTCIAHRESKMTMQIDVERAKFGIKPRKYI